MASAVSAKILLDSLNENVEGLTAAVDQLAAAAQQLADAESHDQKKAPTTTKPVPLTAGH